jgi:hypothetical protein
MQEWSASESCTCLTSGLVLYGVSMTNTSYATVSTPDRDCRDKLVSTSSSIEACESMNAYLMLRCGCPSRPTTAGRSPAL